MGENSTASMKHNYRISLWNYFHYKAPGALERVIGSIREEGYGVEIWPAWFEENNIFDPVHRRRLKILLEDMPSSIHGGSQDTLEYQQLQIDTAAATNSDVIVVHSGNLRLGGENPDFEFAQVVLDIAAASGITIALENGDLRTLERSLDKLRGLKICLDVGHVYFTSNSMKDFVDSLVGDICHLHIQDTLGEMDHYVPGTGIIPMEDWRYLFEKLEENGFNGAFVLEIRPRNPMQHAQQTRDFFSSNFPG
jgi:sugar phosphate isomerase/epimerase